MLLHIGYPCLKKVKNQLIFVSILSLAMTLRFVVGDQHKAKSFYLALSEMALGSDCSPVVGKIFGLRAKNISNFVR